MIRRALDFLYLASCWIAAGLIAAITLLVLCQVCLNLLDRISTLVTGTAIGLTIPSYADFTGFFLAGASFLALAHTLRQGGHIRVNLLITHLPPSLRKFFEIWSCGLGLAVAGYFTWYTALLTRESFLYKDLSSGMIAVPIWIPQLTMLIGLAVLSIALLDELLCVLSGKLAGYQQEGQSLPDSEQTGAGNE